MKTAAETYRKPIHQLSILAALASLGAFSTVHAGPPHGEPGRPFPEIKIPGHANGPRMIAQLGEQLPEVAHFYDMDEEGFRKMVEHDHSVHADEEGRIYYVCEGPVAAAATADPDSTSFSTADSSDAFNLSSMPGAPLTIYLDFDGHTTRGTSWNSRVGGEDIYTPPYDTDGNKASFSSSELGNIVAIWKRVAEDFAPWAVNVTTKDPGEAALIKSSSSDTEYGVRVCIGGSSNDWYGTSAGGVAYIGSFTWNSDTPCFVFEDELGNGNVKYTTEALSHEVGHTLSLYHDGDDTTAYYTGHGDWAPIMGVGYYEPITQWSKGEYANANNTQDDIAVISTTIPLRSDLIADDMTTDEVLGSTPVLGYIEDEYDADIFTFQTDGGSVSLSAEAVNAGNLDIRLGLYDGYGNLITFSDPAGLDSSISTSLSAGTYYVLVEGTSPGDPYNAYTDYGSIGQYRLSGSFATSQNTAPVAVAGTDSATEGLAPLAVSFNASASYDADGYIVSYDWDFGDGNSSTAENPSHTYMSAGTFTASVVVVDDKGASASDSVVITVTEPVEPEAPVADSSRTTPTSGTAPLTVDFDGTGSYDPDGTISAYTWTIENEATLTGSTARYTLSTPGTYTVTLQVTDNDGLTDTESVTITVNEAPSLDPLYVEDFVLTVDGNERKGYVAFAEMIVVDANGRPVQNATVVGEFSGAVNESVSSSSKRRGDVSIRSSKFRDNGSVTFTVTDVVMEGYLYVAN